MKLFHIDASARTEGSHSRKLSGHFVSALEEAVPDLEINRLDLGLSPLPHFGALETAAVAIPDADHTEDMRAAIAPSDALVARLLACNALVIGTPIYNFGMPSTLKAFFDHVSRNGKTFIADENGMRGSLQEMKVAVLSAAGGAYGAGDMFEGCDMLTPHIRVILEFLGVEDLTFISARPMLFGGPAAAAQSMEDARAAARALAARWAG
ncbi:MAG: NAD(P)H-dependent oxidoreductase [Pseudomonadota bacterium]